MTTVPASTVLRGLSPSGSPPLDPDRDEARQLLEDELGSGTYQLQESLVARVWRWFTDLLPDPAAIGPVPPWVSWAVLAGVLVGVLAVVAFATRDRWRTGRLAGRDHPGAVLEGPRRSAAAHREAARQALSAGDAGTALLEAYRALAAGSVERALLEERPGRTAHEVAVGLAPLFPGEARALVAAADDFDGVRYGGRSTTPDRARDVLELEARLRSTTPVLTTTPSASGPALQVPG